MPIAMRGNFGTSPLEGLSDNHQAISRCCAWQTVSTVVHSDLANPISSIMSGRDRLLFFGAQEACTLTQFTLIGVGQQVDQYLRLPGVGSPRGHRRRIHGCELASRRQ
jgi:hypothetical protein